MNNCVLFVIDNPDTAGKLYRKTIPALQAANIDLMVLALKNNAEEGPRGAMYMQLGQTGPVRQTIMFGENADTELLDVVLKDIRAQKQSIAVAVQRDMPGYDEGKDVPTSVALVHAARRYANVVVLFIDEEGNGEDTGAEAWKNAFKAAYPDEDVPYCGNIFAGNVENTIIKLFRG